jgi:hypothetical protein
MTSRQTTQALPNSARMGKIAWRSVIARWSGLMCRSFRNITRSKASCLSLLSPKLFGSERSGSEKL